MTSIVAAIPLKVQRLEVVNPQNPKALGIFMPYFTGGDSAQTAQLNQLIFLNRLGIVAPSKYQAKNSHDWDPEATTQDFTVEFQNQRVLLLSWANEGCGAYCSQWTEYSAIDLRQVRMVDDKELLNQGQLAELSKRLLKLSARKYRQQIQIEKRFLRQKHLSAQDKEYSEETMGGYEQCLASNAERLLDLPRKWEDFYYRFQVSPRGLSIYQEGCFPHVTQALDQVGEVVLELNAQEAQKYLSPFAKQWFWGSGPSLAPPTILGRILYGTVAHQYSFSMVLKNDDMRIAGNLVGAYFYKNKSQAISLQGTLEGDSLLELQSVDSVDQTKESILLKRSQQGTWQGWWQKGQGDSLHVELQ